MKSGLANWQMQRNYIKAEAIAAGSGLGKEVKVNLNDTPYLNITWKVEKDLENIADLGLQTDSKVSGVASSALSLSLLAVAFADLGERLRPAISR